MNTSEPPTYLLVQACQLLWLVKNHDSYKCSLTLTLVSYPNPSPGWSFQERFGLAASAPFAQANFGALSGRLHTRQGCTLSACFHGSQRRDAGFKQRRNASVEQSITTRLRVAIQISCQNQRSKHINCQYIYLISYKIANKANPMKWICPIEKRYHRF